MIGHVLEACHFDKILSNPEKRSIISLAKEFFSTDDVRKLCFYPASTKFFESMAVIPACLAPFTGSTESHSSGLRR